MHDDHGCMVCVLHVTRAPLTWARTRTMVVVLS